MSKKSKMFIVGPKESESRFFTTNLAILANSMVGTLVHTAKALVIFPIMPFMVRLTIQGKMSGGLTKKEAYQELAREFFCIEPIAFALPAVIKWKSPTGQPRSQEALWYNNGEIKLSTPLYLQEIKNKASQTSLLNPTRFITIESVDLPELNSKVRLSYDKSNLRSEFIIFPRYLKLAQKAHKKPKF